MWPLANTREHPGRKPPLSVILIGCLFLATGIIGLAYHSTEIKPHHVFELDTLLILLTEALAIVSGGFMLRGSNWARWLAVLWLAFHVVLSGFHSISELLVHAALLAVVAFALFRTAAAVAYFRNTAAERR